MWSRGCGCGCGYGDGGGMAIKEHEGQDRTGWLCRDEFRGEWCRQRGVTDWLGGV